MSTYSAIDTHSGSYTLVAGDAGKLIVLTGNSTITVPASTFANADWIEFVAVAGTTHGFTAGSGVTLHGSPVIVPRLWSLQRLQKLTWFTEQWTLAPRIGEHHSASLQNLSSVAGASIGDALDNLAARTSGISIPIVPLWGSAGWSGGIVNDYSGSGTGGALGIALPIYPALTLTTILVSIEPNTGHSSLPSGMPFVQLWGTSPFAHANAGLLVSVSDTSASVSGYQNQHTLSMPGLAITTANTDSLWLRINDEVSPVPGVRLKWIKAYYS